jgi:hypothetical protein
MSKQVSAAQQLVDIFSGMYGDVPRTISKEEIKEVASQHGISSKYRIQNANNLASNGEYNFPPVGKSRAGSTTRQNIPTIPARVATPEPAAVATAPVGIASLRGESDGFTDNLRVEVDPNYIPFGEHKTVKAVVASVSFFPVFITGLSGNGKTVMTEQVCAKGKRDIIRVNLTEETDEDDLIGGFRMVDGNTRFFKGPVIRAMELGAILLLDEIDLSHPSRIMCLQSILEGKGYFIKKTGEYITPAPGFNVIATANTKGKGCEDGQFVGTNVLNEAMLERFPLTCEQPYPPISTERKILAKVADSLGITKSEERGTKSGNVIEFIEKLTDWADIIRKTYYDGGVDSLITTRRLIHIINAYAIFDDRMTAIDKCTNRFDEETKVSFLQRYTKIDSEVSVEGESVDI